MIFQYLYDKIVQYVLFQEHKLQNVAGLVYMVMQAVLFSLNGLVIKFIPEIPSYQIIYLRSLMMFYFNYKLIEYSRQQEKEYSFSIRDGMIMRGAIGFLAISSFFYSCQKIQLSEAIVLTFMSPIWTGIIGHFLYNEKYESREFICAINAFIGMILIVKPPFIFGDTVMTNEQLKGKLAAVFSSFCAAITLQIIRKMGNSAQILDTLTYYNVCNIIFSPLGMMNQRIKIPNIYELQMIFIIMIASLFGQLTKTRGVILEKPAKASIINYVQVVLSYFYDIFILNYAINWMSLIGTIMIFSSAVILFYKNMQK